MAEDEKPRLYFVKDKLDAVDRLEVGESVKSIAKDLNVSEQSIRYWKRQKTDLKETFKDAGHSVKKCRDYKLMKNLKTQLFDWFKSQREKGCPIMGSFLATKAVAINTALGGDPNFHASDGWLDAFKKECGIRQINVSGEIRSADKSAAEEYR